MTRRSILPVLALVTLVISLASGMAAASGRQSGWRPLATIGPANVDAFLGDFVVTGPDDAWPTWSSCPPCGGPRAKPDFWIEHWNGRA